MIAFVCKFIPPTNTKGARIKCTGRDGLSVTIPYPYELNDTEKHFSAVQAFVKKYGMRCDTSRMSWGVIHTGEYVFTFPGNVVEESKQ